MTFGIWWPWLGQGTGNPPPKARKNPSQLGGVAGCSARLVLVNTLKGALGSCKQRQASPVITGDLVDPRA